VLYEKYGHRVIYDAHSKLEARLYSVIKDGLGNLRPTHFDQIVNIQSKMSFVPFGDKDIPHWSASKNGMYYCSHTWDSICVKQQIVDWWSLVWSRVEQLIAWGG
jgi:hypothetical protein